MLLVSVYHFWTTGFKNENNLHDLTSQCPCIWFDSPLTHRAYQKHCSCPKTNSFTSVDHRLAVLAAHQTPQCMLSVCLMVLRQMHCKQSRQFANLTSEQFVGKNSIVCVWEKQCCGGCGKKGKKKTTHLHFQVLPSVWRHVAISMPPLAVAKVEEILLQR